MPLKATLSGRLTGGAVHGEGDAAERLHVQAGGGDDDVGLELAPGLPAGCPAR